MANNSNSYLLACPRSEKGRGSPQATKEADETLTLIDPGFRAYLDMLLKSIRADGLDPDAISLILNTHAHPDHYEANQYFVEKNKAKVALHPAEEAYLETIGKSMYSFFGSKLPEIKPDIYLEEGELKLGKKYPIELEILHTPGHSPGSISIYWPDVKVLIPGDVIFFKGVGRTDIPGGDGNALKASIQKLAKLEIEYLLPGHMEIIQGAANVKSNFDFVRNFYFGFL
jgi:glyoxylase-like metal-dependent hydrolase (beta-lactamase superfamily II)